MKKLEIIHHGPAHPVQCYIKPKTVRSRERSKASPPLKNRTLLRCFSCSCCADASLSLCYSLLHSCFSLSFSPSIFLAFLMASTMDDNPASFGSKRSRNDASRKEGDWTCHNCGNLNFSFRTVCNRGHCGAPRPSVIPPAPVTSPYRSTPPPPFYYGGVGTPPPPYGVPGRLGSPIPHSGVQYGYGLYPRPRVPYSPVPSLPPASFGGIPYGPRPSINGYGYGFQSPPWAKGLITDSYASRKRRGGPDGLSEGDWICPNCENVNFAFRTTCNMKNCGAPRPGPSRPNTGIPEGSWTCEKCGNLNYPFRNVCNRKDCGSEKTASAM